MLRLQSQRGNHEREAYVTSRDVRRATQRERGVGTYYLTQQRGCCRVQLHVTSSGDARGEE
jgi:hypothetical protein